jgi:hypothetical protein
VGGVRRTATIWLGPIPLQLADAGDFLFVLAIVVVMFFRFTRVSREQTRVAAEGHPWSC